MAQEDRRTDQRIPDQHGRLWHVVLEMNKPPKRRRKNGMGNGLTPVGQIMPLFKAPLIPPSKYLRVDGIASLTIDYPRWVADLKRAATDYEAMKRKEAIRLYRDAAPAALDKNPPPIELLDVIGPPPKPWQPVEAARQGNKWILGLVAAMPDWAQPFFPPKVEETFEFPDVEFEDADSEKPKKYPYHRGFGKWELSDGSIVKGTSEAVHAAERELQKIPA